MNEEIVNIVKMYDTIRNKLSRESSALHTKEKQLKKLQTQVDMMKKRIEFLKEERKKYAHMNYLYRKGYTDE